MLESVGEAETRHDTQVVGGTYLGELHIWFSHIIWHSGVLQHKTSSKACYVLEPLVSTDEFVYRTSCETLEASLLLRANSFKYFLFNPTWIFSADIKCQIDCLVVKTTSFALGLDFLQSFINERCLSCSRLMKVPDNEPKTKPVTFLMRCFLAPDVHVQDAQLCCSVLWSLTSFWHLPR